MKKLLLIIFALLLLCGCSASPPAETQADKDETTAEATQKQWVTVATTEYQYDDVQPSVIPAEIATATAEPVILETNWDIDIYRGTRLPQLSLLVVSTEPISKADVSVTLPIEMLYEYDFVQYTHGEPPKALVANPGAYVLFTYDHYLHYCNFDWAELAAKYQEMEDARIPLRDGYSAEKQQVFSQAQAEYESSYNKYYEDYLRLDLDMLPQYYCYEVLIHLGAPAEEQVLNTIDLTINGKTTTVDIGEVRFHTDEIKRNQSAVDELLGDYTMGAYSPIIELKDTYWFSTDFVAEEDLLLTGFDITNGDIQYNKLFLEISSTGTNFAWDGKMPVEVPAGSHVFVNVTLSDPRLLQPGFCMKGQVSVEFEVDGFTYQHSYEHLFYHEPNPFEMYAQHFDGIDFTEYYEKYYNPIVLGSEVED